MGFSFKYTLHGDYSAHDSNDIYNSPYRPPLKGWEHVHPHWFNPLISWRIWNDYEKMDGGRVYFGPNTHPYFPDWSKPFILDAYGQDDAYTNSNVHMRMQLTPSNAGILASFDGPQSFNATGGYFGDILRGGSNKDRLLGFDGDDTLTGNAEDDELQGNNGIDTVNYAAETGPRGAVVDLARGEATDTHGAADRLSGIENVLTGDENDRVVGDAFDNLISTQDGDDRLDGGGGDDVLRGGAGADAMEGGAGNDIYFVDDWRDTVSEYSVGRQDAGGIDKIVTATAHVSLPDFVENLDLLGPLNLVGTGNEQANRISGNEGLNVLYGHAGTDTLLGEGERDLLIGGLASDELWGGEGRDQFVLNSFAESLPGTERDVIRDFESGEDKIDLRELDAVFGVSGNQRFAWVDADSPDSAFTGEAGQIRMAGMVLQGDRNGDRIADFEIRVVGAVQAGDILF